MRLSINNNLKSIRSPHKRVRQFYKGFTIVEIAIVISVIVVLTTISTLGITSYLKGSRDDDRAGKIIVLSTALEKYYSNNGEYPSCSSVRDSVTLASTTLDGVDEDAFKPPNKSSSISEALICNSSISGPSEDSDIFRYEPVAGAPTNANQARTRYELSYWSEAKKEIVRHQSSYGW